MVTKQYLANILRQPKLPSTKISEFVRDQVFGKIEHSTLKFQWQFKKRIIRKHYAIFGRNSGLKPGICWPTKDELNFQKQYEQTFEKSIESMKEKLLQTKKAEQEKRINREKEIMENIKKLPKMKEEFWQNYHKLYENILEERMKKEKVIQEVREYLGYDIDQNDPRFEVTLAKKDEETKAALKAARKLEKQKENLEMLQALVADVLEKEKSQMKSKDESKENNPDTTNDQK